MEDNELFDYTVWRAANVILDLKLQMMALDVGKEKQRMGNESEDATRLPLQHYLPPGCCCAWWLFCSGRDGSTVSIKTNQKQYRLSKLSWALRTLTNRRQHERNRNAQQNSFKPQIPYYLFVSNHSVVADGSNAFVVVAGTQRKSSIVYCVSVSCRNFLFL